MVEPVRQSLAVVNQALMDSCALVSQPLSHRSASNKQLFSEDVMRYRGYVQNFFKDIQNVDFGTPLDFAMNNYLTQQSQIHARAFDPHVALRRLAEAALRYSNDIDKQLRSGTNYQGPPSDGTQLADEFAGIVRDLRMAGIGGGTNVAPVGYQVGSGNSLPSSSNGLSFTATPLTNTSSATRPVRSATQGQQSNIGSYQVQQSQYIMMKQPTHL